MKHVVGALLLTGGLFVSISGSSRQAHAEQLVVVEAFEGPESDKLRKIVKDVLGDASDIKTVSDGKLASAEAELGLMQASDAYDAVAKQLGAAAFVKGTVKGRKRMVATITVHDASGKVLGNTSVDGKNARDLLAAASKELPGPLTALIAKSSGAPAVAKQQPAPTSAARKEPPKDVPKEAPKKVAKAPQEEEKQEEEKQEEPVVETQESEAEIGATADTSDVDADATGGAIAGWTGLDVTAGALIYSRSLSYNQLASGPTGACTGANPSPSCQLQYSGPATAIAVSADYYFLPFLGVTAGGEFTVATSAKQDNVDGSFAVKSMAWFVGVKGKYTLEDLGLELNGQLGYGQHSFEVSDVDDETLSNVAPVAYGQVRALAGARYDLGPVAVTAGGGYLHILSMGDFTCKECRTLIDGNDTSEIENWPGATAIGAEANAGVAVPLSIVAKGFEARVQFVYRTYGISMNSIEEDAHIAGGATDNYMGINIGAGYRLVN